MCKDYFINIDHQNKAYILGLLFADGHFGKTNPSISLQEDDMLLLESVKNSIGIERPLIYVAPKENRYSNKGQYYFSFTKELHGILLHTNYNKTILPQIEDIYMPHFIRGLFDGDGCISIDSCYINKYANIPDSAIPGTFYILLNYYEHAVFIRDYLSNVCGVSCAKIVQKKGNGDKEIYMIRWSGTKNLERIRKYLYNEAILFMYRKKNKFDQIRSGKLSNAGKSRALKTASLTNKVSKCLFCNADFIYKRYKPKVFCSKKCQLDNLHKNRLSRLA